MKVSILNQQSELPVTKAVRDLIKGAAETTLKFFDLTDNVEISVMLTDNEEIRTLNKLHRNIDRATDVLSFPMFEYDEAGNIQEEFAGA